MLSPEQYYKRVHKDRAGNLRFRQHVIRRCHEFPTYKNSVVEACAKDLLFYVNAFVWTYDPRMPGAKSLPFITYPYQDIAFMEILACIEEGRDLVIEKSRDMGASWMSLTVMEWLWHFHPGQSFLMVSRKEDLVDAPGDSDSLFWKVDFIHRHLPGWLRPDIDRRKLHFGNLGNSSTIDGESTTAAAGVGGRRTAMFIDEFSRIEEGHHLLAGTADTTRCRIFNFTPWGTNNAAYKLAQRPDVRKLRLHWQEHPEKARGLYRYDQKMGRVVQLDTHVYPSDYRFIMDGRLRSLWYDGECIRRNNEREIAQMIDIDYQGSEYQFFDRGMIQQLQNSYGEDAYWQGDIEYDSDTGKPLRLVEDTNGPLKLWCYLTSDGRPPAAPYAAGADISTGSGATNSCLTIADARTGQKVLEYASPYIRSEHFAPRATALCWLFKDADETPALFAWEMQGPGVLFGQKVIELNYLRVYFRTSDSSLNKKTTDTPGWVPTTDNKRALLEDYRAALGSRAFSNPSKEALAECLFFIHTSKGTVEHSAESDSEDPTGARSNHGDRVVADALCWKMCKVLHQPLKVKEQEKTQVGSLGWRRMLNENARREQEVWL